MKNVYTGKNEKRLTKVLFLTLEYHRKYPNYLRERVKGVMHLGLKEGE